MTNQDRKTLAEALFAVAVENQSRKRNEVFWISPTGTLQPATYRIHRRFKKFMWGHLPIVGTLNFTPIKYLGFGEDE